MDWQTEQKMHENRLLKKLIRLHKEDPKDWKQIKHTEKMLDKYNPRWRTQ